MENEGSENGVEPELSDEEREIVRLLGDLKDPVIPTAVSERISHAIAAEAVGKAGQTTDASGAAEPGLVGSDAGHQGATVHELAPRRRSRTKVWGALAAAAAVAAIGVVGVNVVNSDNALDNPSPTAGGNQDGTLASTPVVISGITYLKRTLHAQVQNQMRYWKSASQQIQVSPGALTEVDRNGRLGPVPEAKARELAGSVQSLRQELPQCLTGIGQEGARPLAIELAQYQETVEQSAQRVVVVAIPKSPVNDQAISDYTGPVDVYVLGIGCTQDNPDLLASTTVEAGGN